PVDRSAGSFIANRTGGRTIHEVGAAGGRFRASRLRQITRTQTRLLDLGVVDLVEVLGEAAELGKGLLLDLSNALARDGELSPHLFESMVAARPDAEAHAQDLGLARGELRQCATGSLTQPTVGR